MTEKSKLDALMEMVVEYGCDREDEGSALTVFDRVDASTYRKYAAESLAAIRTFAEEAMRDAERYAWLRNAPTNVPTRGPDLAFWDDGTGEPIRGDDADAAIDAARAASPQPKEE